MAEEVKKEETKTKTSWANRIWSAIVGAAVAVAGMFGITQNQIASEKAKVETVKAQATAAYEALKAGDVKTAAENLQVAIATGTEAVKEAKEMVEKAKAEKGTVVDTIKEKATAALVKDQVAKVEKAETAYKETTATEAKKEEKAAEVKKTDEVKKVEQTTEAYK